MATVLSAIDINADVGEGCGNDAALMPLISSANICCGAHAGDQLTTAATIELALQHQVAIGAHPGYADKANFGRVELNLSNNQVITSVDQQLRQFVRQCERFGASMQHIKFHGALYHRANNDVELANALCIYLRQHWPRLLLFAKAATPLIDIAHTYQLTPIQEGFIDRRYQHRASLMSRQQPNACHVSAAAQQRQYQQLLAGRIDTVDDGLVEINVDTLCLHGDSSKSAEMAKKLHHHCQQQGIVVRSCR